MIIYFSGTGNTKAVAEMFGDLLKEQVVNMCDFNPGELTFSGERFIILTPIYSWGIAPFIIKYLENLSDSFIRSIGGKNVYFVCTCGDDTGKAPEMIEKILFSKGISIRGIWSVQMPNNYVLLPRFDVDSKPVERSKLEAFPIRVKEIAALISEGKEARDYVAGKYPGLKTSIVYPLFKRWGISPSKWYPSFACIGCGKCELICPVKNIKMKNSRPQWGSNCVSCLACYHVCPKHAVQYGKATHNKGQYMFPHHKV